MRWRDEPGRHIDAFKLPQRIAEFPSRQIALHGLGKGGIHDQHLSLHRREQLAQHKEQVAFVRRAEKHDFFITASFTD